MLNGYLILSKKIYGSNKFNGSWNFGPDKKHITVGEVIANFIKIIKINKKFYNQNNKKIKETKLLSLNINKSKILKVETKTFNISNIENNSRMVFMLY